MYPPFLSGTPPRMKTSARAAAALGARNLFRSGCGRTEVRAPVGLRRWHSESVAVYPRIGVSRPNVNSRFRGNRTEPLEPLVTVRRLDSGVLSNSSLQNPIHIEI